MGWQFFISSCPLCLHISRDAVGSKVGWVLAGEACMKLVEAWLEGVPSSELVEEEG